MNAHARVRGKPVYPGKVAIRHAVEAAKACGLDVVGIDISPDGTIRILDRSAIPDKPKDEFEEWLQAGKLG
jgi:glutathione synthase/RimK-type ligase-like ATP-grasp enzyme